MENRLNGEFCWPNVFHFGFEIQSFTWTFTAELKIYSQLPHIKKWWNWLLKNRNIMHVSEAFRVVKVFVNHMEGPNMIYIDRSSVLAAWIEYRFKKQDFTFKILVKPRDFRVKHYMNIIYMRIVKNFFLKFTIFEIIFQSRFKSPLLGLHVFFAFFRK